MAALIQTRYSLGEEIAHTITHGIGAVLSIAGLTVLVAFAALNGDAWHIVSSSIYGATLVILYSASSLYHGVPHPGAKAILKQLDHAAIYLLIAGTYTPIAVVALKTAGGWWLLGGVWAMAIIGMVLDAVRRTGPRIGSLILYVACLLYTSDAADE